MFSMYVTYENYVGVLTTVRIYKDIKINDNIIICINSYNYGMLLWFLS